MMKTQVFNCCCNSIEHIIQLNRFDNEVEIYCSLILQPLPLRERLSHFVKFLLKKDSFNDYYSGISFYRKEQEGLLELTKLNTELSDALNCKKEDDDYVCDVETFERKFPMTRMWVDQKTKKHMEEKREVPEKGITITNVNDPPDLNSMSISNISDCFCVQDKTLDEFSIQVVLNRNVSFLRRFLRGIKYVFGKCSYFELVLNRKAIEELKKVVEVNFQYEPNDGIQILTAYGCPMPVDNYESMYKK